MSIGKLSLERMNMLNKELCFKCYTNSQQIRTAEQSLSLLQWHFGEEWKNGWCICNYCSLSLSIEDSLPPENCPFVLEYALMEPEHV